MTSFIDKMDEILEGLESDAAKRLLLVTLGITLKEDAILALGLELEVDELKAARAQISDAIDRWNRSSEATRRILFPEGDES